MAISVKDTIAAIRHSAGEISEEDQLELSVAVARA